jgi:competence protein ComGC
MMTKTKKSISRGGFTLGELLLVFAAIIIMTAVFTPFMRHSNESMARVDCANNLRTIGLAMYIYARENNGEFPPSLDTLYSEQYLGDVSAMNCPSNKTTGTRKDPDYMYTPGLTVRDESRTVLVRDRDDNHAGGGNILYVNGTIEWKARR